MPVRSRKKPEWQLDIAKERIDILFDEASKMVKEDPKLANRYVEIARKIGMRYNVRIPQNLKRKICKKCKAYISEGLTARKRIKKGKILITCFNCQHVNRYPFK